MSNILFKNANLVLAGFASLQPNRAVLVKDKFIHSVSSEPIEPGGAMVIDVAVRTTCETA